MVTNTVPPPKHKQKIVDNYYQLPIITSHYYYTDEPQENTFIDDKQVRYLFQYKPTPLECWEQDMLLQHDKDDNTIIPAILDAHSLFNDVTIDDNYLYTLSFFQQHHRIPDILDELFHFYHLIQTYPFASINTINTLKHCTDYITLDSGIIIDDVFIKPATDLTYLNYR